MSAGAANVITPARVEIVIFARIGVDSGARPGTGPRCTAPTGPVRALVRAAIISGRLAPCSAARPQAPAHCSRTFNIRVNEAATPAGHAPGPSARIRGRDQRDGRLCTLYLLYRRPG